MTDDALEHAKGLAELGIEAHNYKRLAAAHGRLAVDAVLNERPGPETSDWARRHAEHAGHLGRLALESGERP